MFCDVGVTVGGDWFAGKSDDTMMHRERNGEKTYEIFSESVTVNQGLADNLFTVPGPDARPDPPRKK